MKTNSWRLALVILIACIACILPASALNSNIGGVPWNSTGSGCWTYVANGYTYMMWNVTGKGTWTVPSGTTSMGAIIVGGGGGGAGAATGASGVGGGGAGGLTNPTGIVTTPGAVINVSIGPGGAGGTAGSGTLANGVNGTMSQFMSYIGYGGGGGGGSGAVGWNGASAGGSGNGQSSVAVAVPSWNEGHNGGQGGGSTTYPGGGGGGLGGVGTNGVSGTGGAGGVGSIYSLGAINDSFSGGGGGATDSGSVGLGTSGGGNGGVGSTLPTVGANGWGGGGGGADSIANAAGAAGGSGVIIVRFVTPSIIIVNFNANTTVGYASPYPVLVTDASSGSPDTFNWTWGDGRVTNQTTNLSTMYQYSVAGAYTVSETAKNTGGGNYNYTTKTNFINLTTDVDANVMSWMHMNGTDGGTTFTDLQGNAWAATGATTQTSSAAFLGSAGSFAVNDARITSPSSTTWNLNKGPFEMEFWINVSTIGDANKPVVHRSTGGSGFADGWGFFNTNATVNGWSFWWGNGAVNTTPGINIPLNTRTMVTISRNASGYVNVAKNGVWQTSSNMGNGVYDVAQPMEIGANGVGTETSFLMDEFRLSTTVERWPAGITFTTPYTYYKGNLYQGADNPNPNATLRYKTDPGTPQSQYNTLFNGTPRSRTVQIQNVSSASQVSFGIDYDQLHESAGVPIPNTTTYADIQINSYTNDVTTGVVFITASRTSGSAMTALLSNRTSIVDVPINYINYTTDNNFSTFFTNGTIYNSAGPTTYPINNFILSPIYYGTWPTPNVDLTADNVTPAFGQTVTFTGTSLVGYPNAWNWSFGDGQYATTQNTTHAYATTGLKTVSLTGYQLANASITNTTTIANYINVQSSSGPIPAFTANRSYSITTPLVVQYNITDSTPFVTSWNWSYGDNTWGNYTVKDQANSTHTYNNYGPYSVSLYETNNAGIGVTTKSTGVVLSVSNVTASSPTIGKLLTGTQLIQLQNVTNVDGVSMNITFNATSLQLQSVALNASAGTGVSLATTTVDNTNGLASIGLTGNGFSYGSTNTSALDLTWLASGITNQTEPINFNTTTGQNFITTNATTYNADRYVAFTNKNPGLITFTNNTFTKTITVININTQLAISGAVVSYTYNGMISGSGSTTTGMFNVTSTAGTVAITTSADGYYNATNSFSFTNNNAETIVMTPLTGPSNPQTWFAPKPVTIYFRNAANMQPMPNLKVTALFNATTLPATGTSWLYTMYGMNAAAAAQALTPGLYMNGTTDSIGETVFTLQPSIGYNIQAIDSAGTINNYMLTPRENGVYYLNFNTAASANATDNYYADIVASGNTWSRPYVNPSDTNNFTAMFSFQDLTNYTTKVDFIVANSSGTILYITNQSNPIAGGVYRVNFTFPNVRGNQITAYQNLTRSV